MVRQLRERVQRRDCGQRPLPGPKSSFVSACDTNDDLGPQPRRPLGPTVLIDEELGPGVNLAAQTLPSCREVRSTADPNRHLCPPRTQIVIWVHARGRPSYRTSPPRPRRPIGARRWRGVTPAVCRRGPSLFSPDRYRASSGRFRRPDRPHLARYFRRRARGRPTCGHHAKKTPVLRPGSQVVRSMRRALTPRGRGRGA